MGRGGVLREGEGYMGEEADGLSSLPTWHDSHHPANTLGSLPS